MSPAKTIITFSLVFAIGVAAGVFFLSRPEWLEPDRFESCVDRITREKATASWLLPYLRNVLISEERNQDGKKRESDDRTDEDILRESRHRREEIEAARQEIMDGYREDATFICRDLATRR